MNRPIIEIRDHHVITAPNVLGIVGQYIMPGPVIVVNCGPRRRVKPIQKQEVSNV